MPLEEGSSKEVIGKNIATEREHGKPEKQAVAIAMRKAGVPKPAKDAAAHDPHTGQFTSGSGSSGKSKTDYTQKAAFEMQHKKMYPKATQSDIDTAHKNYVASQRARDEQPAAITQASSGMPAYRGRNLDAEPCHDAGIASPAGCDWPGRVL